MKLKVTFRRTKGKCYQAGKQLTWQEGKMTGQSFCASTPKKAAKNGIITTNKEWLGKGENLIIVDGNISVKKARYALVASI